ncbi:glycosyl hydrolase family 28-related protein [Synechocystis sp. PCC 7509]|uniref:glycosyl hydrolase family 28-related protein n=1 Tax=Synechocystis sp. PCC 7509 TaxID=927677 RepID=UPI0002ACB908|nr:glycosyl hydrolase family 28-related protein [Synechocystis sp. PCC 7509]
MFKLWLLTFSLLLVSAVVVTHNKIEQITNNSEPISNSNPAGKIGKANSKIVQQLKPDLQFPPDAGIFNVTDYEAKPNDGVDDTANIQLAIATALKSKSRYSALPFIYFPKGTYNISNQLESRIGSGGWSDGWRAGMILMGESSHGTVIKLANDLVAFSNPKKPLAVIKTGSEKDTKSNPSGAGNRAFRHSIYNLTIDVGRGNYGAVGIDYLANNRGAIEDVNIRSEKGEGYAGILMKRYAPGPALVKNTSIEGFDYGVWIDNYEYSMTFEHLRLKNQKIAGIFNQENVLNIRDLVSNNSVPAIESVSSNGQITLLDSNFNGGAANNAAIATKGKIFIRNITSTGYGKVVDDRTKANRDIPTNALTTEVEEYTSKKVASLSDSPGRSLLLPIEETPEFHSNDFRQWKNVVSGGATPDDRSNDDAQAIQAAIDSNHAIVYLPRGQYHVGQTIILRGKVRKFLGMQASLTKKKGFKGNTLIRFEGNSTNPTILEHLRIGGIVEHASPQTLAMRHIDIGGYRNTSNGTGKLFVEDAIGSPYQINSPQKVWARQLNAEFGKVPLVQNHGGTVWILGMKTEGKVTAIETVGGTTELLGALLYPLHNVPASIPAFINDEGRLAVSYAISGQKYAVQVKERRRGQWRQLASKNVPSRGEGASVPLYTGFIADKK